MKALLWECPDCAFGFDRMHTDEDGGYSCPLCELAEVRERIAANIEEYAAPIRKQYELWLFTYGSAVEPGSRDPELESMLTALFHAARIARGQS